MGDISYRQSITVLAGQVPLNPNTPITTKYFEINPADVVSFDDISETDHQRYAIPPAAVDFVMPLGTVNEAKVLIIKPEQEIDMKIINASGESQNIRLIANRTSIFHGVFTGLKFTNPHTVEFAKGNLFVGGE